MLLHDALITGNYPKARRLIGRRVGINCLIDGETPLMLAVLRPGKEHLTQLLLAAGAQVDAHNELGETALMLALHSVNNLENVVILIHAGADTGLITSYAYSACDYALKHPVYDAFFPENKKRRVIREMIRTADPAETVELCLKHKYDVNLLRFALLDAVYYENVSRVEVLLESGAPANSHSIFGWSALRQAACRAHLELVKLLLRYGADPAFQDHEGRTALTEMKTCIPGLRMTELIYLEDLALDELGEETLSKIKAAQINIERLLE